MEDDMKLFKQVELLINFDDLALEELVSLEERLHYFNSCIKAAKANRGYFLDDNEYGALDRARIYPQIFGENNLMPDDDLSIHPKTIKKVYSLRYDLNNVK